MNRRSTGLLGSCVIALAGATALADAIDRPWLPADAPSAGAMTPRSGASYMLGDVASIDLDDPRAVLGHVMSQLADEVKVIPTENYLYWRFHTADKYIWGNVRLEPGTRDENFLHIGYYEFREDLTGPEEAHARYALLGPEDGIATARIDDFLYDVSYGGRTVRFALNEVSQALPVRFALGEHERFVMRTHDESGIQFHLLFDEAHKNFMFVANEDDGPLDQVVPIGDRLTLDTASGFLFYVDADHNDRKVLVGVYRRNTAQNNYYDGPADQLADNYVPNVPEYQDYLNQAYAFTRGVIDQFGFYVHDPGNRVAVAPYYTYESVAEVQGMMEVCGDRGDTGAIMACMIPGGYHAETDEDADLADTALSGVAGLAGVPGLPGDAGAVDAAADTRAAIDVLSEDWEGPDPLGAGGWMAEGLWHLAKDPPVNCPPAATYVSPITSAYYGIDGACNYDDGGSNFGTLTSPVITDLPLNAVLSFWHRRQTEGQCGIQDISEVQISTNGVDYDTLWAVCEESNAWVFSGDIGLAAYAGKDVQIRFFFDAVDPANNGFLGWMIDDVRVWLEDGDLGGGGVVPIRPRHMFGITWHLVGVSFAPPGGGPVGGGGGGGGPVHMAGTTWHLAGATFVPRDAKHNSGSTWHYGGQTFIPAGTIHNSGSTWHYGGQSFIPKGSKHNSGSTWHVGGVSFIPKGSKHAAGTTWHIAGASFIPKGSKHNSGSTWHVVGESFIPKGSKHAAGTTWHIAGASFIPKGAKHNSGSTWHVGGVSFVPKGAKHAAGTTFHIAAATFIPKDAKHNSGSTWHVGGVSFIPKDAKHASGITWHIAAATFVPKDARHNSGSTWHVGGVTFIPKDAKHASGITWHIAAATFVPKDAKHNSGTTWHVAGETFIPKDAKHASGITWHLDGISFIPGDVIHNSGTTWHYGGQTFIPEGTIHNSGVTWHYLGESFIPEGTIHNSGSTWHYGGQTFIPAGTKHNSGSTWHVGGVSFIPSNARHMAGDTWHATNGTFLAFSIAGGVFEQCDGPTSCPEIACHVAFCNGVDGTCDWTPVAGDACDDGDPYSLNDTCDSYGACVGQRPPGAPCDDGNPCTVEDRYTNEGECVGLLAPGLPCDDGNHCTGPGQCSPEGVCQAEPLVGMPCDDGDECNAGDVCSPDGGCFAQLDIPFDDMQPCNGEETCDSLYGPMPGEPEFCTAFCAGEVGVCDDAAEGCIVEGAPSCDDGDPCTIDECNVDEQLCETFVLDCDDGNPCTADACSPTGGCDHVVLPEGQSCDDGRQCTTGDFCLDGACVGVEVECSGCTACDPDSGACDLLVCLCGEPGDSDGDGDVDLGDYAGFHDCVTGPGGAFSDPACTCFDFDGDSEVDLFDFAEFTRVFTGS